jgi:DNA primase
MTFAPVPIADLLAALGIEARQTGTKWLAPCPHPDHQDKHPSWFIRDDPGERWHGSHNCKSCGLGGGPWELVAAVRGVSVAEAAQFVRGLCGGHQAAPRDIAVVKIVAPRRRRVFTFPTGVVIPDRLDDWKAPFLKYLRARSITDNQIRKWGLGYATTGDLAWRVVIPIYTRGRLQAYTARAIFADGSRRYDMPDRESGARPDCALWGEAGWDPSLGAVTVAEGVFSAMALERVGAPNATALLGSELTLPKVSLLSQWPVILVATDPDAAGDKAFRKLHGALRRNCHVERIELPASPDDADPMVLRHAVTVTMGGFPYADVRRAGSC